MAWTDNEREVFSALNSPINIQRFLDGVLYDAEGGTASPRFVLKELKANCFEGALFAAATLENIGYKPLIVDMTAHNDDDHVIAVYKWNDHWGAIAKSNTSVLRYREPVYRSIRELVMSYFDLYLNIKGEKTLRSYTSPVNLKRFDRQEWRTTSESLDFIGDYLCEAKHYDILDKKMKRNLSDANKLLLKASLLGSIDEGLYKPE